MLENKIPKKMRQTDDEKENLIMKSYRFRVLENKISGTLWNYLKQSFGNQRFVWNHFLREMENHYQSQNELKKYYKENNIEIPKTFSTTLSFNDLCTRLTMLKNITTTETYLNKRGKEKIRTIKHFLYNTHSQPLQSTLRNLSDAMEDFRKGKKGKPQPKRKIDSFESCFFKQFNSIHVDFKGGYIILPKTQEKLYVNFHRFWKNNETPKTLSLTWNGKKMFVSIQTERKITQQEKDIKQDNLYNVNPHTTLAYDLGCNKMLVTQSGKVYHFSKSQEDKLKLIAKKIIFLQQKLSHKLEIHKKRKAKNPDIKYSKQYLRIKAQIQKLYEKSTSIKKDFLHKVSHDISKSHTCIIREDLKIKEMTMSKRRQKLILNPEYLEKLSIKKKKNPFLRAVYDRRNINRKILGMSWGIFNKMVEYKVKNNMGLIIKVDPAYTSQCCSQCKHVSPDNRISQEKFHCQSCGFKCNADHNAAINIYEKGLLSLPTGSVAIKMPVVSFIKEQRQNFYCLKQ